MRRTIAILSLAAVMAAPTLASARGYCEQRAHDRRVTGTVLGAVGGALLGNAVSKGGGGAVIGGLGGAVVGNQIARTKCQPRYGYSHYRQRPSAYDRPGPTPAAYDNCRYETRSFYDERGRLIQQPTRVCGR